MRVTALVENADHVCCRYRIAAFRPNLERAGHSLTIRAIPRHWWSWLGLRNALRAADVVILQRRLLQGWQRFLLRGASRSLIFDFDDAVFLRDSYAAKGFHSGSRLRRFAALARAADAVAAGNAFLRDAAARSGDASRLHVIPTCVEPNRYPMARHVVAGAGVRLVWVGSSSTLQGLESSRPLLEDIGKRTPGLTLKLICDRFLTLSDLHVEPTPWTEAGEPGAIAEADIGISYLPDDPWSRGKCGLKVLQYMAAGLPVVANPVGVQRDMIRHGESGFLVETADEWAGAVARLAHDPGLRRRMGQAGRCRVERDFSVAASAARWLDLLDQIARSGRKQRCREAA